MPKIIYEFVDKTSCEVEVSNGFYLQYLLLKKQDDLNERTETRRHSSLDTLTELGAQFGSEQDNPLSILVKRENNEPFEKLFELLSDEQRELLELVYIDEKTMAEIAKEQNLASSTVRTKISRILKKIKKFF